MVVPTQTPPPPSYSRHAMQRMEAERKLVEHEKFTFWSVIWILFGFKLGTIALVLLIGYRSTGRTSGEAMAFIAMTSWYWLFIPLIAISGFVAWKLRLRKARKQADQLRQAEFTDPTMAALSDDEKAKLRRVYLPEHER